MHPAEHAGKGAVKRPHAGCTADRCMCKWLLFQMRRENAKLKRREGGK